MHEDTEETGELHLYLAKDPVMLRVVGVGERIRETELRYLAGTTLELAFDGLGVLDEDSAKFRGHCVADSGLA